MVFEKPIKFQLFRAIFNVKWIKNKVPDLRAVINVVFEKRMHKAMIELMRLQQVPRADWFEMCDGPILRYCSICDCEVRS